MRWAALAAAFVVPLERPHTALLGVSARHGGRRENLTHATEYVGRVTVGGRTFKVLFDTGSDQLLLPSVDCPTCGAHTRYNASASAHAGPADAEPQEVTFGMGSAMGYGRQDQVCIEGHCGQATFLECLMESEDPFLNANFDGVLGLSLKLRRNATNSSSVLESLAAAGGLDAAAFAVVLAAGAPALVFGKDAFQYASHTWAPVSEPGYWQFSLADIAVGGKALGLCAAELEVGDAVSTFFGYMCCHSEAQFEHEERCQYAADASHTSKTATDARVLSRFADGRVAVNMSDGCVQKVPAKWVSHPNGCRGDGTLQAALDTGMSLVMGPKPLVDKLLGLLGVQENCTGHGAFPDLGLHLPTGENLTLAPEHYMDELVLPDGQACWPHFMAMPATGKGPILVLGIPFFRAFATVFDAEANRIGFSPLGTGAAARAQGERTVRKAGSNEPDPKVRVLLRGWRGAQPM